MKKIITLLILFAFYSSAFAQASFSQDPSNNRYHSIAFDLGSNLEYKKIVSEVNGIDYGTKMLGNTWTLKGSQVYMIISGTVNSVSMYYAIYKSGSTASFNSINLSENGPIPYGYYTYFYEGATVNILDVVNSEGTWYVEFYWVANTNTGDVYLNNSGANYKLNFTADASLPVELTTFSAFAEENKVALNWETATEVNNYGFEIERQNVTQIASNSWEKIGFVEGHGNSNSPKIYSYADNTVSSGEYYYRLRQVDIDGQFEYSDVVEVNISAPNLFELSQNYPNPFNPKTNIQFSLTETANVSLIVYNTIGQKVAELINQRMEAGVHNSDFDGSNLNSGIYIYMLKTEKSTLTKKMILMK